MTLSPTRKRIGLVYSEQMTKHAHPTDSKHVEGPARISVPYKMLKERNLLQHFTLIDARQAKVDELLLVHRREYIDKVCSYRSENQDKVCRLEERWPTYVSDYVYDSASCAAGSLLNVVDAVVTRKVHCGVALVRPPGHHAEVDESCGFCYFNNVSIAAKYAQKKHKLNKVLILDWDIHHGNGIQHIFYDDSSVMYISIHRFDNGEYFPGCKDASQDFVGKDRGEGFNVNIPFNKDMMGDAEYKAAFDQIVLPLANQYAPDLILIAAGFDAAAADPLGDYILSSDMYGYMTQKLQHLADGRLILALEGGYNVQAVGESIVSCVEALLGKKTFKLENAGESCKRAEQTIAAVIKCQSKYWNL